MHRRWAAKLLVSVVGLIALAGMQAGCEKQNAAAAAPPGRPPAPVTVATAITRQVPVYLDEIGRTQASELVNIQSQVAGQIMERHFQDGEELTRGKVLFVIDPRPFQAKVKEAQANLGQANSQLELAQAEYDRTAQAARSLAVSAEDLSVKKGALDNAKAAVQVSQAALETANLNLSYCTITAPIDGRAGQRQVDVGNIVKVNDTTLLTIQRQAPLYVDFTITERDLPRVRDRLTASTLKAQVTLPERPDAMHEGDLTFLDTMVQPNAGRVQMRATLANADRYFWPGQFVNVRLVLNTLPEAVLIPYQCVQIAQQGPFVYVVGADGNAKMHPITIGQRQGELVVIEKGVAAGEKVVQTGQLAVTPDGPVHVVDASPAPGAATTQAAPGTATQAASGPGGTEGGTAGGRQ